MHKKATPVRTTILYGFAAALFFVPAVILMVKIMTWPLAFRLAIWAIILGYSYLLVSWSGKGTVKIIFPQLILLAAAVWSNSVVFFLVLAILVLGWIRQRCFMKSSVKALLIEIVVSGGAVALILFFNPHSTPSLAISTWLFFLAQSLYFVFFCPATTAGDITSLDLFTKACKQAEEILSP
jgi:hypothetical protein